MYKVYFKRVRKVKYILCEKKERDYICKLLDKNGYHYMYTTSYEVKKK